MTVPELPPPPPDTAPPDAPRVDLAAYHPGRRCWVYRAAAWRPAVVLFATSSAATVRYRDPAGGTSTDTVTADQLHLGPEHTDPYLSDDPAASAGLGGDPR